MSRVAELVGREQRERLARMSAEERVREALALGSRDVAAHAAAHGLTREEARRALERSAQKGRRASQVMAALIG